ncbi:uncharacterized protein LOC131025266 isoform X2 [Salvia miltiorrhiza]|uniref:uncharacterized protein LOC131025266 isoform X2 n=1 Tax=Salvia miltiorrhiza TaxID=226208 RepID=UPI0025ACFF59|nr:uncharacterized protein LOC131025266 isoform X2 [Salvia miltiorrhiza]XP_057810941.1 uncharacterized protein LOC131025266 isoform X2 [Salvia miltiorrhiza]
MISLFHARCSTILSRAGNHVLHSHSCVFLDPSWKASFRISGVRTVSLGFLLTRSRVRCYASKKPGGASSRRKGDPKQLVMDKEEFFVVRKGDLVGVYRSLSDCQAQAGTSICDPPVSVYKGCSMPKDTENYLRIHGLKNALYSIRASDLTDDLFGTLVACPFQPSSREGEAPCQPAKKKLDKDSHSNYGEIISSRTVTLSKSKERTCTLEFDGASKGNPGQAGAGAILRYDDGSVICRLSEGIGIATCNFAEYRGVILGLRYAADKGFTNIRVQGDSKLVCMQGLWKVKSENLLNLYKEAKELVDRFRSFQIVHVLRDLNSEADAQANIGAQLAEGEIQEDFD